MDARAPRSVGQFCRNGCQQNSGEVVSSLGGGTNEAVHAQSAVDVHQPDISDIIHRKNVKDS